MFVIGITTRQIPETIEDIHGFKTSELSIPLTVKRYHRPQHTTDMPLSLSVCYCMTF